MNERPRRHPHGCVTGCTWQRRGRRCRKTDMMSRPAVFPSLCIGLVLLAGSPALAAECARPTTLRFEVQGKIVRSQIGFTQGLEWRDGKLFESTGAIGGHSGLNIIAPDGTVTSVSDAGTRFFGEGLTVLNDEIYQLTWQEHDVFVYDLSGRLKRTMKN